MPTYAIGDVQGCDETLARLLDRIAFDPAADRLWFAGDIVNRGPASLAALRRVHGLRDHAIVVLGNHDLHLLAAAEGWRKPRRADTLAEVLDAQDAEELLAWLRARPLLHVEEEHVLVHAGLLPSWTVARAAEHARDAERAIRGRAFRAGDDEHVTGLLAVFTRLRTCNAEGVMEPRFAGPPDEAPEGYLPWFDVPGRASADHTLVFGHWAALGLVNRPDVVALDTGCVWGGTLTAVRLDDRRVFQEPVADDLGA